MAGPVMTIPEMIDRYEEEARAMLECARLNPREDGSSIYMQMAIMADRRAQALKRAINSLPY